MTPVSRGNGPLKERYRPRTLSELAPTTNVSRLAVIGTPNASRVYLFEGNPGCGKTSAARIIARKVGFGREFETDPSIEGEQDYVEINAADCRGIDDMRSLVETFNFRPQRLQRRIFVLDEIHQLTGDAQEVLTKALEDPPEHVLVILCTTSTKNVKKALLQRAERFVFSPLGPSQGIDYLRDIYTAEVVRGCKAHVCTSDLAAIYEASGGSVREMLNLLQGVLDGGKLESLPEEEEGGEAVKNLFNALVNKSWNQAKEVLASAEVKGKPEAVRIGVENYARAICLKDSKPRDSVVSVLEAMSGSLAHEPVQISQYNLFVLKCLRRCVGS